ncbi:alfa-L-rhamnosidase [Aquipluma nitroreducens]|uniref:Alfa-L-rhamnosidase n=1 Tax=Aquipluma nitroreducens TaxID=2010828 RepID=A0A5K7S3L1_9BACT|nr:alpha-L-rhamnosidase C-terminal domain-containing protein [Aquipluma nitroreducens]BBE16161.1 alfa-L-rhamnosidase [Aquipluma nitroreducens]
MNTKTLFALFSFLLALPGFSQKATTNRINPELLTGRWAAYWINHPTESPVTYGVYHFRKTIMLDKKPGQFIVHVSADNRYKLYVNGQFVCLGPSRGDLLHWRFETVDIAPYLVPGKNVIAAEVWNYAQFKPAAQFSIQTGFILQGNSEAENIINTNKSWKVIRDWAYTPESGKTPDKQYIVVGPCVRINGEKYLWGWNELSFDDKTWEQSAEITLGQPRVAGTSINWGLAPREIPFMEMKPQRFSSIRRSEGLNVPANFLKGTQPLEIKPNQKVQFLIDQGILTTAYPEMITSGGKGSEIKFTYAEAMFDNNYKKGNRNEIEGKHVIGYSDYFMPDGGDNRMFKTLWFRTWRYVQVEIKTAGQTLKINDVRSVFTAYPLEKKAVFESDDKTLDGIWDTGWQTARLCANETYFDCPYYEQLQYVGDTRIQALISLYVSGDDRLARQAIQMFGDSRFSEGLTMSRYPAAVPQVIPPYSLFWVDMVHDYWMLRDDSVFVRSKLNGVKSILDWFIDHIDPKTGLLGKVPYWNFVDWPDEWEWNIEKGVGGVPKGGAEGQSSILTLHLAYSARHAAELLDNYKMNGGYYRSIANSLVNAVTGKCKNQHNGYIADTPDQTEYSMHAQIFGALTDAIPSGEQKEMLERIQKDDHLIKATMYFRFYLTRALQKAGMGGTYLQTLDLWKDMLKEGLTTFAERPDPTRSDCHAWSASPNYEFLALVAGIRPSKPGFKEVVIEPALGSLKWINGQMPHPLGAIYFHLERTGDNGLKGSIELPQNLKGTFIWNNQKIDLINTTNIKIE